MKQEHGAGSNSGVIPINDGRYLYMSDYNQVINACMENLFIKHGAGRKIPTHEVDIDEAMILKRVKTLSMMTFEVTENCNLRCKYCVFGEHYGNWRDSSPRSMDFETARKGIDYIFSLIKDRRKKVFYFCFYGGEPLLNVETIKKIVRYGKERMAGWELGYVITTNLTALDDDILDFLESNNFSLMVSLDGCKENHDSKRVFANGKGSFDIIYGNLEKSAANHKDYFKKFRFSSVYSPDLSFKKMFDFFTGDPLVKDRSVRYSMVNTNDTGYYEKYPLDEKKYRREFNDIFSKTIERVRRGEELTKFEAYMYNNSKTIGDELKTRFYSYMAKACIFDSRLYLDAGGRFHVCERINQNFSIGDVENGFDFQAMAAMIKKFTGFMKNQCSECNFRLLCTPCYIQFTRNGDFQANPGFCDAQKKRIVRDLERYIQHKEEGLT